MDVGRRCNVLTVRAELREPVAVEVRLVADDVLADRRHTADEVGREAGELVPRGRRQRRHAAADGHDRRDDPDVEEDAGCGDRLKRLQLIGRHRALARLPVRGDADRVESRRLGQLHFHHRDLRVRIPALVLGGAHVHVRAAQCRGRGGDRRQGAEERDDVSRLRQQQKTLKRRPDAGTGESSQKKVAQDPPKGGGPSIRAVDN